MYSQGAGMGGVGSTDYEVNRVIRKLSESAPEKRKNIIDELVTLLSSELRERASGLMGRERSNHILQTTALFHETYLRLVSSRLSFDDRRHFLAMSSRMMRQIVIDIARRAKARKRGDGAAMTGLDYETADKAFAVDPALLLDINRAIGELDREDQELIELRFFYGLTLEETAEAMNLTYGTLRKRWVGVRRELFHALNGT
jgi:RNA polymerase sigma factor (TIGR02999 family)